jgi:hypothetical protein
MYKQLRGGFPGLQLVDECISKVKKRENFADVWNDLYSVPKPIIVHFFSENSRKLNWFTLLFFQGPILVRCPNYKDWVARIPVGRLIFEFHPLRAKLIANLPITKIYIHLPEYFGGHPWYWPNLCIFLNNLRFPKINLRGNEDYLHQSE